MSSFTYRRRVFLASVSTGLTSYIVAEVESSRGGDYKFGSYLITLADCHRRIEIEFGMGSARVRRQSMAKIDLLIEVLSNFRLALRKECDLINDREGRRSETAKKARH